MCSEESAPFNWSDFEIFVFFLLGFDSEVAPPALSNRRRLGSGIGTMASGTTFTTTRPAQAQTPRRRRRSRNRRMCGRRSDDGCRLWLAKTVCSEGKSRRRFLVLKARRRDTGAHGERHFSMCALFYIFLRWLFWSGLSFFVARV